MGKKCIYTEIKWNKGKNNATFKGKQRDNVNKAQAPTYCTSVVGVEISKPRKQWGGGGGKKYWG
jgi:hypothetical protein